MPFPSHPFADVEVEVEVEPNVDFEGGMPGGHNCVKAKDGDSWYEVWNPPTITQQGPEDARERRKVDV